MTSEVIKSYTKDGTLMTEHEYVDGECIRKTSYYTNADNKIRNAKAKDEYYKTGLVIDYYPDGKKECEGVYIDGIRSGKFVYYNSDGSIDMIREYDYTECQKIIDEERKIGGANWENNAVDKIRMLYKEYDVGKLCRRITDFHPVLYKQIYTYYAKKFTRL